MERNAFFNVWTPRMLSVLRFFGGALLMQHGAQKLFGVLQPHDPPAAAFTQTWFGGVLEFFGGLLLAVGLFTRPVAFLLSGTMAVAYFQFHGRSNFWPVINMGELAVAYCILYLYLFFAGGGSWSIDALFGKRKTS